MFGHGTAGFALSPNTWPQLPEIFEVVKLEYGYLRVTANATHMQHQVQSKQLAWFVADVGSADLGAMLCCCRQTNHPGVHGLLAVSA